AARTSPTATVRPVARHATRSRVRPVVALLAAVVAGGLGGCGDDAEDAGPDGSRDAERACAVADGGRVRIMADDLAWDVDCLEVPADEPVTIVVDNRDDGVAHNVHLTDAPGAPSTALETGPVVQE